VKQKRAKESIEGEKSDSFPPDLLAILPKKVAAAVKNVPLSVARKKLPDELALYLKKVTKKVGADWRKSKVKNGAIATDFKTITSAEIQRSEYEALGLNRSQHIVIQFNRKRVFQESRQLVEVFPSPSGMSGGGVYAWSEEALKAWPVRLPLVGIANEFIPDKGLLIATRLHVYIRGIHSFYPELFTVVKEG
jgi:hypothetical protein